MNLNLVGLWWSLMMEIEGGSLSPMFAFFLLVTKSNVGPILFFYSFTSLDILISSVLKSSELTYACCLHRQHLTLQ